VEYNPLESETRRESAVIERAARADLQAELDRAQAELVRTRKKVEDLRWQVSQLESIIREGDRHEELSALTD
jgi:predicted  nucleic acid-binding Zn-ribbon protein